MAFSTDTGRGSRVDPITSTFGSGSLKPLPSRLGEDDEDDDDPLDIDILDIWRQDEGVDDDGLSDEDEDEIAFLDDCDDDELDDD